ncbi:hypothetical protein N9B42_02330 [Akkermansiaceae bacterium]|nr:hypothetical protein [Akkermansiaceae bacterium]
MSGTLPTTPGFTNVTTKLKRYNLSSDSLNGRIQVRSLATSRREFTLSFPPMTKAEFEPIYEFVESQDGMLETFSVAIPDPSLPGSNETVTVRLANDVQEFSIGIESLYEFEIDVIEVI